MTVIVGCVARGKVWLGGDASINGANTIEQSTDPKVWRSGGVLLGAAGDWTALDLLRRIDCPEAPDEQWIRHGLLGSFRRLRREIGIDPPDGDDFEILIGALGALWWSSAELAAVRLGPYAAIGAGAEFALGSLWTCQRLGREAITKSLHAAGAHCPAVRGPYALVSL